MTMTAKTYSDHYAKVVDDRFNHHTPSEEQIQKIGALRVSAKAFAREIAEGCPEGREKALALTKLEEALMWANKAVVLEAKK